jgi:SAM-dependent methyltransferase
MTSFSHDNPELARTYDRVSDSQFESGKRLVERLALKTGHRVLDVGCGTGRLAAWMAEVLGQDNVVGIDPLPDRITLARERAPGIRFEIGRAEDLGAFASETFDCVCMSSVFHWVQDKPRALAEAHRVLRPGGRLGLTTLPKELRDASTTALVAMSVLGRSPYRDRLDLSSSAVASMGSLLTDLVGMLIETRFDLLELHVVRRTQTFATGDEALDFLQASSFGHFLQLVPDDLRAPFRADLVAAFDARRGPDGIAAHMHRMVVVAARPAADSLA